MREQTSRFIAERHGRSSETLAALLLMLKGYRILARRVRTPLGEIDLVALSPEGAVCFVEVKARAARRTAQESLGAHLRQRIARARRPAVPRPQAQARRAGCALRYGHHFAGRPAAPFAGRLASR